MSRTEEGRSLRRRLFPSPALVVAMIALLAATAGSALANHGGRHGPPGIVIGYDVGDGTLTGVDIKDHSLTPKDFRGSVRGPRGRTGARGPQGPQGNPGANGANGAPGPAGAASLNYIHSTPVSNPAGLVNTATLNCDAGQYPLGGGATVSNVSDQYLIQSRANRDAGFNGWQVTVGNGGAGNQSFAIYVVCSPAGSVTGAAIEPAVGAKVVGQARTEP